MKTPVVFRVSVSGVGSLCAALLLSAPAVVAGTVDIPVQAGGGFSVPVTSVKEARFLATMRQQFDFSCGSAALSTLLTYHYDYPVTEQQVFAEMFQRGDRARIRQFGFSLLDMKRYLENHGFQANGYEAPLSQLSSANIPAIALINDKGYSHFVVIKGLRGSGPDDGRVLIGDPAGGTRAISQERFDQIWVNRILFVIDNRNELAHFNQATDWRSAPSAPLDSAISREGLTGLLLPKHGPGDF